MLRNFCFQIITRNVKSIIRNYSFTENKLKACIVGSGPAGFYTAQQILKHPSAIVDMYEKLPVPFGLVRFGVAPDHPEVKNVINTFTKTALNENFHFFGNVNIGKDVSFNELRNAYHAVVLCYGAESDLLLDIPGEDFPNVISARKFVGWYNGIPEDVNLPVNLNTDTAIIIGQGNVALDVARIMLTPPEMLKETDITQHALDALYKSKIKKVILVGRRGPLQVAFTIKELREMTKLPKCYPTLHQENFEPIKDIVPSLPKPRQRLTDLMIKTALNPPNNSETLKLQPEVKTWELKFLCSPLEITSTDDGKNVKNVIFGINKLEEVDGNVKCITTEEKESINCGLVLKSIGYQSICIDSDLPFDKKKGIIPNEKGRVSGHKGLYCSGWVRTGPKGVILHTMTDSFETGKLLLEDIKNGVITSESKSGNESILSILKQKDIIPVKFSDWQKIDTIEQENGRKVNKSREKILNIVNMLDIIKK